MTLPVLTLGAVLAMAALGGCGDDDEDRNASLDTRGPARASLTQAQGALNRALTKLRRAARPRPAKLKRATAGARKRVAAANQAVQAAC